MSSTSTAYSKNPVASSSINLQEDGKTCGIPANRTMTAKENQNSQERPHGGKHTNLKKKRGGNVKDDATGKNKNRKKQTKPCIDALITKLAQGEIVRRRFCVRSAVKGSRKG